MPDVDEAIDGIAGGPRDRIEVGHGASAVESGLDDINPVVGRVDDAVEAGAQPVAGKKAQGALADCFRQTFIARGIASRGAGHDSSSSPESPDRENPTSAATPAAATSG